MALLILLALLIAQHIASTGSLPPSLGACYGTLGDNLLPPPAVIKLYKTHAFSKMRIYNPSHEIQRALQHSSIGVSVGVANKDLAFLAGCQDSADLWVNTYIIPYKDIHYNYIVVGNEAIPGEGAQFVAPAMQNMRNALNSFGLNYVTVTTAVSTGVLGASYPPSKGAFSDQAVQDMTKVISFLRNNGKKIMVNVFPYFAYANEPNHISLDFAQFAATSPVIQDGGLLYYNLFDAMVDAFYGAMEKIGMGDMEIIVGETGWPSAGNGNITTPDLAQRYNCNFIQHVASNGTPKRPNYRMEGYIFAMFNENQKSRQESSRISACSIQMGLLFTELHKYCNTLIPVCDLK